MFAIKSGVKFIRAKFFLDPHEVYDFSLSDEPKTYKQRSEADRIAVLVRERIVKLLARYTEYVENETRRRDESLRKVEKLQARLAELYLQPYGEVEKKVANTRKAIEAAEWYIKNNSIRSWTRDISRLERIRAGGVSVVKIQQTVEA